MIDWYNKLLVQAIEALQTAQQERNEAQAAFKEMHDAACDASKQAEEAEGRASRLLQAYEEQQDLTVQAEAQLTARDQTIAQLREAVGNLAAKARLYDAGGTQQILDTLTTDRA